tara:strand:- start:54 stop:1172 length:1119 start_codon:yes stop_codon:yes gene_type:complete
MELIFHKSERYIEEDIFYYISDQRDKHSMIKPKKENLISMTVDSDIFAIPNKKEIVNVFYPFKKNSIDKIYIGLSFPLFSNNWAASYLRYLLKIIKKDGSIILPVYPEEQADEKGMWSRSFLENIFTSRTGWTGRNNVWAENDGVMSMRIGKKFPKKPDSTLNYFLDEISNQFYRSQLNGKNLKNTEIIENIWSTSKFSPILEKIILEKYQKRKVVYADISENPSLAFEVSVSDYISINKTIICSDNILLCNDFINYFSYRNKNEFISLNLSELEKLTLHKPNIVSIINNKNNHNYLQKIHDILPEATIIFYGESSILESLQKDYNFCVYSSIVATKLEAGKTINHYSDIIEEEINLEKDNDLEKIYVLTPK